MRLALPDAPAARLLVHLTEQAGLRRWWDPACVVGQGGQAPPATPPLGSSRVSPGLDADGMSVFAAGSVVIWRGEVLSARFDLDAGLVDIDTGGALDAADRAEVQLAFEVALATLGWAANREGPVTWTRRSVPVALAYDDAWSRVAGPEGLGSGVEGQTSAARLAGVSLPGQVRLVRPPRAVVREVDGALLRVAFGPGESVNAAQIDLLTVVPVGLPDGWLDWITRRLGMTWVAQLGE